MMRIGYDIDGPFTRFVETFVEYYNKKYGATLKTKFFRCMHFWETIGGNREEAIDEVFDFFESDFFKYIPLVEGSQEAVRDISLIADDSVSITSRQDHMQDWTRRFISSSYPEISTVHFAPHYRKGKNDIYRKADLAKKYNVDLFVEDDVDHSKHFADFGIPVILINRPWNEDYEVDGNTIRVNDWREIVSYVKNGMPT